jgi:hypothetical protein
MTCGAKAIESIWYIYLKPKIPPRHSISSHSPLLSVQPPPQRHKLISLPSSSSTSWSFAVSLPPVGLPFSSHSHDSSPSYVSSPSTERRCLLRSFQHMPANFPPYCPHRIHPAIVDGNMP